MANKKFPLTLHGKVRRGLAHFHSNNGLDRKKGGIKLEKEEIKIWPPMSDLPDSNAPVIAILTKDSSVLAS